MPLSRRQCLGAAALLTAAAAAPSWAQGSTPIPAHAGNSRTERRRHGQQPVHSRARGEQPPGDGCAQGGLGSSPRTRGTASAPRWPPAETRFIPAHAGNRTRIGNRQRPFPVHPRARGEQSTWRAHASACAGSSPRTRGTVDLARPRLRLRRFIPAHAGNSRPGAPTPPPAPVHPRARGEQVLTTFGRDSGYGSSPRTRGTERMGRSRIARLRFIPAHAGNRASTATWPPIRTVHPRARGEQASKAIAISAASGSSPRTRGTERRNGERVRSQRFIPAHAGNSIRS